jgi:beta-lactamase regulating signal transducer with metallopeptidase domain
MQIIQYILFSSVCLSMLYLAYRMIYRNETNFRQMRVFLMGSVMLSLLLPLSNYKIEVWHKPYNTVSIPQFINSTHAVIAVPEYTSLNFDWTGIAIDLYLLITAVFLIRLFLQLIILAFNYIKSEKLKRNDCVLLFNHRFRNTFSFFDWIFIGPGKIKKEDLEHIIIHERIHATQYHTLDLIVIELLTAVMWFNPLIWMMKNSIQLVHEYLADEGALNTGIDKHRYQALLINQITEDKLISLSSSFNHSLIKKRMKMMLNKKFNRWSNLKIMALIPLAGFLFFVVAVFNALMPDDLSAAPAKPLNVFGFNPLSDHLNSAGTPADTIKTKTIKIIHKQASPDSIITETYNVRVIGDTARGTKIIYFNDKKTGGDTSTVMYVVSKDHPDIMLSEDPDSLVDLDVQVSPNVNHKEKIFISKSVTMEKSSDQDFSDVLFIIDGVEHKEKDAILATEPNKIESIEVIKDKKTMKKYTDKDYEGVIIITTKAKKK